MKRILFILLLCLGIILPARAQISSRPKDLMTEKEWNKLSPDTRRKISTVWNELLVRRATQGTPVQGTGPGNDAILLSPSNEAVQRYKLQLPSNKRTPPDEGNYVYNRWCDMDDVNAVYVSPQLFKMMKTLPAMELNHRKIDFTPIIKDLKGLYMLELASMTKDGKYKYSRNSTDRGLRRDIRDYLDDHHYVTLMENRKNPVITRLFWATDGTMVNGFVLVELDNDFDSGRFICLEGQIPQDKFENMITQALQ